MISYKGWCNSITSTNTSTSTNTNTNSGSSDMKQYYLQVYKYNCNDKLMVTWNNCNHSTVEAETDEAQFHHSAYDITSQLSQQRPLVVRALTAKHSRGSARAPWEWSGWVHPGCEHTWPYPWTSHCIKHQQQVTGSRVQVLWWFLHAAGYLCHLSSLSLHAV